MQPVPIRFKLGDGGMKRSATDMDVRIGENIRAYRIMRSMTQQHLATALGISFQQLGKYESGTNRISASTLHRLAEILRVPVQDFFAGPPLEVT